MAVLMPRVLEGSGSGSSSFTEVKNASAKCTLSSDALSFTFTIPDVVTEDNMISAYTSFSGNTSGRILRIANAFFGSFIRAGMKGIIPSYSVLNDIYYITSSGTKMYDGWMYIFGQEASSDDEAILCVVVSGRTVKVSSSGKVRSYSNSSSILSGFVFPDTASVQFKYFV